MVGRGQSPAAKCVTALDSNFIFDVCSWGCRPNWTGLYGNDSKNISWPIPNKVIREGPTQPSKAELFCWSGNLHFYYERKYMPYKFLSTHYILCQFNSVYTFNYIPQKRVLVLFSHVQLSQKRSRFLRFYMTQLLEYPVPSHARYTSRPLQFLWLIHFDIW
jgi:hypothetical protein